MRTLALLVLCAGCVELEMDPAERHDLAPDDHAALAEIPDPPASCTAVTNMAAQSATEFTPDSCAATVDVEVACSARAQVSSWMRIGLVVDGGEPRVFDLEYGCNKTFSHTFSVPCEAQAIYGGATFDHPQNRTDVSCVSESI
jgi:hypothetical protein